MTRLDTSLSRAHPPTPPIWGANAPMGRGCGREGEPAPITGEPVYVVTLCPADPVRLRRFLKLCGRGTVQERIRGLARVVKLAAIDVREVRRQGGNR